ncbi:MAG: class I SAM-dependent methyltransferase [Candidatus Shapirobacteria bacterium]|nr:class I SAM-dependent methyltransferase [Candidatus Shapirobacteria bacterium]
MGQTKWNNIGWQGDEPTGEIVRCFSEGIIKERERVLDVGCGFGRNSNWLASKGVVVTAVNIDNKEIDEAMEKAVKLGVYVNYFHANATRLPLKNNYFDAAIDAGCSHLLPDNNAQQQAEKEVARTLKPGGYLIYFGFSKKHPAYKYKPKCPMFRDLSDIEKQFGRDFKIIKVREVNWNAKIEENVNYKKHIGLNILMRKRLKKTNRG